MKITKKYEITFKEPEESFLHTDDIAKTLELYCTGVDVIEVLRVDDAESLPFRCPVCNGCGAMPLDFYGGIIDEYTSLGVNHVVCKTCNGKGVVWREDV